jgi:hypothetical protein
MPFLFFLLKSHYIRQANGFQEFIIGLWVEMFYISWHGTESIWAELHT